jgi:hypothetical protein
MLVEIKTLRVENEGYKRNISLGRVYVNSNNIISITDYAGATSFLIKEQSGLSEEKFSLIKLSEGSNVQELIAFGSAEQIFSTINGNSDGKKILND